VSRPASEHLSAQHGRFDRLLVDVQAIVDRGDFPDARDRHAELARAVDQHLVLEETTLFPLYEEKLEVMVGPTRALRREHGEIRRLIDETGVALANLDAAGFLVAQLGLGRLLRVHAEREERLLYPVIDRLAGEDGELLARIERP
jgi:hemerythrin-like domain-containing protein